MPHTMIYNLELHIIEIKHQGTITLNEIIETFSEAIQIVQDVNCFLTLGDYRNANVNLSTIEIHQLPKVISDILIQSGIAPHKLKRAFVVAKNLNDFHFFETVTFNNGQLAKIFQDIDEAKKWLLQK